MHINTYTHIHIEVSGPTVVEADPKASFSIASTTGCIGGCYFFHRIVPLTLIMLSVMQGGIKYHFFSLWNDLTSKCVYTYTCVCVYIYKCLYISRYLCVYIYIYIYKKIFVYIYIYIYK